ncbi:hypothetical protein J2Z69_001697 [Paenibacillus shirakamiensis]|uniref:Uncharacterized protein n=1 Tax=Paenibacillus shirakamiensis TaxID=1265935 RepID=A0ABS4JI71_9BACL|nr:hypothetical protein [Paenibacillus shirakamiensis]MBP2000666.1 hypothetical protein [Paenibacillus shirakamiensis]
MTERENRIAINTAIERSDRVTILLQDGSRAHGLLKWDDKKSRLTILTNEGPAWVPFDEVVHVTRIIAFKVKSA